MAWKKRYYKKRGRGRYRRRYKRRNLRIPRSLTTGYLYTKQKHTEDTIVPIQTPGTLHAVLKTFQLSDLTQNWGAIFDQFRIVGVQCKFWATSSLPGTTTNPIMMYTSVDLDGQNVLPATESDLLQRSNIKQRQFSTGGGTSQMHSHYLRPRTAKAIYSGGVLSAYGLDNPKTWLDIRSANAAPHYGLIHGYVAPSGNGQPIPIRIQTTYYIQFRKVI